MRSLSPAFAGLRPCDDALALLLERFGQSAEALLELLVRGALRQPPEAVQGVAGEHHAGHSSRGDQSEPGGDTGIR